jgi:hypothetical protein
MRCLVTAMLSARVMIGCADVCCCSYVRVLRGRALRGHSGAIHTTTLSGVLMCAAATD